MFSGWKKWLAIGVAGVALLVVGGPFVYIHFVEGKAPAPLALSRSTPATEDTSSTDDSGSVSGTWKVTSGSQAGYRVKEILFGQSNVAVGRTSNVTGTVTLSGTTVTAATFTVDMTTVTSDESRRDGQFQGRIMDTSTYPTSTFTLTKPIAIGAIPGDGVQRTAQVTGSLTLHGVTRTFTFTLTGERSGGTIKVSGSIPVTFADYNISNPSFGPAQTEDNGTVEFLLALAKA